MGSGSYSKERRHQRVVSMAVDSSYYTAPTEKIFVNKNINSAMNPFGVKVRESRDSTEHPNSLAIILALDETGSMGSVPHFLVKHGLPNMMDEIIKKGIADPQVLFLGIGDHECDDSPLQVGQFESSDELLDKWLTSIFLEGKGGGNAGESYLLAWYFAAYHTSIDCWEKRKQKGFLFTIGDEPVLRTVPAGFLKALMGDGQYENYSADKLLEKAMETYSVYHVHIKETASGSRQHVMDDWRQRLHENLIIADHKEDVSDLIVETITKDVFVAATKHFQKESSATNDMVL